MVSQIVLFQCYTFHNHKAKKFSMEFSQNHNEMIYAGNTTADFFQARTRTALEPIWYKPYVALDISPGVLSATSLVMHGIKTICIQQLRMTDRHDCACILTSTKFKLFLTQFSSLV